MSSPFDVFKRSAQPRFGGEGPTLNGQPGRGWYTIQVQEGPALEILKKALRDHNAPAGAWVSINDGAGPRWVPLNQV